MSRLDDSVNRILEEDGVSSGNSNVVSIDRSVRRVLEEDQIAESLRADPERAARVQRAEQEFGVSRGIADRHLDALEAKRKPDVSGIFEDAPITGRAATDPDFASLIGDEIDQHRARERAMRGFWENAGRNVLQTTGEITGNFIEGAGRVGKHLIEREGVDIFTLFGMGVGRGHKMPEVSAALQAIQDAGTAISEGSKLAYDYQPDFDWGRFKGDPTPQNLAGYIIEQGAGSLPHMAAAIGALPAYFLSETERMGEERADNKGQPMDMVSMQEAIASAAMNVVLERIGAKSVFDLAAVETAKQVAKAAGTAAVKEGGTEFIQEVQEYYGTTAFTGTETAVLEALDRGVAGMVAGAGMGGAIRGTTANIEYAIAKYNRSMGEQDIIDKFDDLGDSKLRDRSAPKFRKYVEELSEAYGVPSVVLDREVYFQSLQEFPELQKFAPQADGSVEIPMADYTALPKKTREAIRPHLRVSDGLSQVEAQTYEEQQMERLEGLIKQAEGRIKEYARAKELYKQLADQIKATGAYTARQSELMAIPYIDYIVTKAEREQKTVDEVWNMLRLEVRKAGDEGPGTLMDQPGLWIDRDAINQLTTVSPGDYVDGRLVREKIPNLDSIEASFDEYTELDGLREIPIEWFDVDIPEDGEYLLWDKPLSDSDKSKLAPIRDSLDATGQKVFDSLMTVGGTGGGFYGSMASVMGDMSGKTTSMLLKKAGYAGIKYLDGTSRGDGEGSYNYVIFDDADVSITRTFYQSALENDSQPSQDDVKHIDNAPDVPTSVDDAIGYDNAMEIAKSRTWENMRDFKAALIAAGKAEAEKAGVDLSVDSPQVREYLTRVLVKDAKIALEKDKGAVGWYDVTTRAALEVVSLIHPEIAKDPVARFAFTWGLAVTSNGIKVDKNFDYANQVYTHYKATGRMPTDLQAGPAQAAINKSLGLFNELVDAWGIDSLMKFMMTNFTVGEIGAIDPSMKPGGEHVSTAVRGAAILGPKIGNGFFANLNGAFDALTMDRWLIRTWGRYTGTLIKEQPEHVQKTTDRLQAAINGIKGNNELIALVSKEMGVSNILEMDMASLAEAIQKSSMDKNVRDIMNESDAGQEFRKAGNSLAKYLDGQKEAPGGPVERNMIRAVFSDALAELQANEEFAKLTMSDLQAVLWYAERRIYSTSKAKDGKEIVYTDPADPGAEDDVEIVEVPNYLEAAKALARSLGVSERKAENAARRVTDGRPVRSQPEDGGTDAGRSDDRFRNEGFAPKEKRTFRATITIRRTRRNRQGNDAASWSYARASRRDGKGSGLPVEKIAGGKLPYLSKWVAGRKQKADWSKVGLSTPDIYEVDPVAAAPAFAAQITASKASKFGAAVYVYPVEDYAKMRLFMTKDGAGGFAIKPDGDIVSVFSGNGYGHALMDLAITAGGKKLDCFDTILPDFYSDHGFRSVGRVKWDDSQSPEGWDKATFKDYNNGEPDVVMMVYDPLHYGGYVPANYMTYGGAVRAQSKAIREIDPTVFYQDAAPEMGGDSAFEQPGFYSALARGIESATIKAASASGWKSYIKSLTNKGLVKPDEIYWTGIEQWLDIQDSRNEKKISKEAVALFLNKNGVQIREVSTEPVVGESRQQWIDRQVQEEIDEVRQLPDEEFWSFVEEKYGMDTDPEERSDPDYRNYVTLDVIDVIRTGLEENEPMDADSPLYERLTLPGGQNYREILLINPDAVYKSSHWDKRGVVAHLRVNDRIGVDTGFVLEHKISRNRSPVFKTIEEAREHQSTYPSHMIGNTHIVPVRQKTKVLFIEEIQSDWAQEGRKKGFVGPRSAKAIAKDYDALNAERRIVEEKVAVGDDTETDTQIAIARLTEINREMTRLAEEQTTLRSGIHRGPFVTNTDAWVQLALKRLMVMAVNGGYDRVAFINGDQSAERYDLSKQVDVVYINKTKDGLYDVSVQRDRNEEVLIEEFNIPLERVEALVGKDLAKKAEEQEPESKNSSAVEYRGVDLKVGGEGMKAFYDKIVPSALKKMSGKFGLSLDIAPIEQIGDQLGFDVTDKMKEVISGGLPLFQNNARASIEFPPGGGAIIRLSQGQSDLSSFFHEAGHFFLEMERRFAASPDATDRQKKDFQTILDFIGAPDGNIQREHHEKFARAFEMYLAEGNAPSVELKSAFRRFAQWITQVYLSLRNLDVELTPEIRGVMDRMLATDAQIERAHQKFHYELVPTKEEEEKQAKKKAKNIPAFTDTRDAKDRAKEKLRSALIKELKSRQTKEWKEERRAIVDEEKAKLSEERRYKTIDRLKETKINRDDVLDALSIKKLSDELIWGTTGQDGQKVDGRAVVSKKLAGMTDKEGMPAEDAAQLMGYSSANEMLKDIIKGPSISEEAGRRADAEMLKRHGDMQSDARFEAMADEIMHNEEQGKALLNQLRAMKPRGGPDLEAIKQEAKEIIGRLPASKIKPDMYYRAEVKHARAAEKALAEGDVKLAAFHKQQQIVQFYLAREATVMKARVERYRKALNGWSKRDYRVAEVAQPWAINLRVYASLWDFKKTDEKDAGIASAKLQQVAAWISAQQADENAFLKPQILDGIMARQLNGMLLGQPISIPSYDTMTVDELQGVYDMASHMRWMGGQLSKEAALKREAEAQEVIASIEANSGKDIEEPEIDLTRHKVISVIKRLMLDHIYLRNKIEKLDGNKDGILKRLIYDKIVDASYRESQMNMSSAKQLQEIFKPMDLKLMRRGAGKRTITRENGKPWTLGTRERVMFALYWGSPESQAALLEGYDITVNDANAVLSTLSSAELDFVEAIWKFNDQYWPEFSAMSTRMFGSTPPKVEALPYTVNGRKMSGGYMRLYYRHAAQDAKRADIHDEAQSVMSGSGALSMSRPGAANERVGSGGRKPLLDPNSISRATSETIHAIAFSEVSREVSRLMMHKGVASAIERKYGAESFQSLWDNLYGIFAGSSTPSTGIVAFFQYVRTNMVYAHLAYSVRNFVQQPTAFFNVMGKVGEINAIGAVFDMIAKPKYWYNFANERSPFMVNRTAFVNREAAEQIGKINTSAYMSVLKQFAFSAQTFADMLVAYPAWVAGYKQGLAKYSDETKAARYADDIVSSTVGSGMAKDLSPILMGAAFGGKAGIKMAEISKQFTFMGSFFNAIFNLVESSWRTNNLKTVKGQLNFVRQMTWYMVAPAIVGKILVSSLPGEDDDEGWATWMAKAVGEYGAGTVFYLRDIVSALRGFSPSIPVQSAPSQIGRGVLEIGEAIDEESMDAKDVIALGRAMQPFVPLPGSGQVFRSADYWQSYDAGEEGPFSLYDMLAEGREKDK